MRWAELLASRLLPQGGPSGPGLHSRETPTATMAPGAEQGLHTGTSATKDLRPQLVLSDIQSTKSFEFSTFNAAVQAKALRVVAATNVVHWGKLGPGECCVWL